MVSRGREGATLSRTPQAFSAARSLTGFCTTGAKTGLPSFSFLAMAPMQQSATSATTAAAMRPPMSPASSLLDDFFFFLEPPPRSLVVPSLEAIAARYRARRAIFLARASIWH